MKKKYIIPLFVPHLGCPHKCVFCNQYSLTGTFSATLHYIENELNKYLNYYSEIPYEKKEIAFYGGSFTAMPIDFQEKLLDMAYSLKKKNEIQFIRISTRPDYIDGKIIELLKKYGVDTVELGVQSLDDEVLRVAQRDMTAEDCITGYNLLRKYDFKIGVQLLPGLPKSNENTILSTVRKVVNWKPNFVRIYPLVVLKNTLLYQWMEKGEFTPLDDDFLLSIVAKSLAIFALNNIPVIRLGIHNIFGKNYKDYVAGGLYYDNLRDVVQTYVYKYALKNMLKKYDVKSILVNNKEYNWLIGYKQLNKDLLLSDMYSIEIKRNNNVHDDTIIINNNIIRNKYELMEV